GVSVRIESAATRKQQRLFVSLIVIYYAHSRRSYGNTESKLIPRSNGEDIRNVVRARITPAKYSTVLGRKDEICAGTKDKISGNSTISCVGLKGVWGGRQDKPLKVAAEGVVEAEHSIGLEGLSESE